MHRRPPRPSASDIPSVVDIPQLEPDYLLPDSDTGSDSDDSAIFANNSQAELNFVDKDWAALPTGDPNFGPPLATKNSEKKLLDACNNQSSCLVTPTVANIVKPFYKPHSIKTIQDTTVRLLVSNRAPSASSQLFFTPQWQAAKKAEQQAAFRQGHTTASGNQGEQEPYKVNDFVIYEDERYPKIIQFGKVIRLQACNGSNISAPSHRLHLHLYQHSQQSFLQEFGQADELFQLLEHEDINSTQVLGTCIVREESKLGNSQSSCQTGFDFISRFAIVSGKSQHTGFTDLSTTHLFCRSCSPQSQSLQDCIICRNGDTVHKGDCVRLRPEGHVAEKEGLCWAAIITAIHPRFATGIQRITCQLFDKAENGSPQHLVLTRKMCDVDATTVMGRLKVLLSKSPSSDDFDAFHFHQLKEGNEVRQIDQSDMRKYRQQECQICHSEQLRFAVFERNQASRNLLDLFAGGGGLSLGLSHSKAVALSTFVEISPSASKTLRENNYKTTVINQDIAVFLKHIVRCTGSCQCPVAGSETGGRLLRKVPDVPVHFEVVSFGPPCQKNSSLNRFSPLLANNFGILSALSVVEVIRPQYIVMENVPGLRRWKVAHLGDDAGKPLSGFSLMIKCLLELGYQCRFGILNAQHYGVPQHRRRLFLVGAKQGLTLPDLPLPSHYGGIDCDHRMGMVLPDGTQCTPPQAAKDVAFLQTPTVKDTTSDLPPFHWPFPTLEAIPLHSQYSWIGFNGGSYTVPPQIAFQRWLRCEPCDIMGDRGRVSLQHYTRLYPDNQIRNVVRIPLVEGSNYNSLPSGNADTDNSLANPSGAVARKGYRKGAYERLIPDGYYGTITTNFGPTAKQARVLHPEQRRVVTIRELARAQSFPDNYVFHSTTGNTEDMIRQIGNAVCPLVGRAIGQSLLVAMYKDFQRLGSAECPMEIDD